ncbi:unnamed protein product [Durusdinium trenchii]|uniref:Uncharacterized protein n=1 Tax=Durusdinium trenchii TaxID=1381693 RepID=A0ABP0N1J9_9DINO
MELSIPILPILRIVAKLNTCYSELDDVSEKISEANSAGIAPACRLGSVARAAVADGAYVQSLQDASKVHPAHGERDAHRIFQKYWLSLRVQDMVKYLLQKHPENLLGGECLVEGKSARLYRIHPAMSESLWPFVSPSVALAAHWSLALGPWATLKSLGGPFAPSPQTKQVPLDFGIEVKYDDLMQDFMDRFQEKRTNYDIWGTWILLSALYALPLILLSFCLPRLRKDLLKLKAWVLRHVRALEVFFYLLSIASNALSLAPLAGRPLGRLAGVLFGVGGALGEFGDETTWQTRAGRLALSASFQGLLWASVALSHEDPMAGLCAMLGLLAVLSSLLAHVTDDESEGDELRRWVTCLAVASILVLVISQATLRSVWYMALGGICCGHLTTLSAFFLLSLGPSDMLRQMMIVGTIIACILVGLIFGVPSLTNSATCSLLLWFWAKCLEAPWGNWLFKVFISVALLQIIRQHPNLLLEILNPTNLYAVLE